MINKVNTKFTSKKIISAILYGVLFWILLGYIVLPIFNTFMQAFQSDNRFSFDIITNYFSNENNIAVVKNTIALGLASVVTCGVIGVALALYMTYVCDNKYKGILHILLLSPMMIPGVIIVISFIQLYGESGIITKGLEMLFNISNVPYEFSGFLGVLFVITYTQYVYFYLNIYIALKYVDYSAIEAARGMGASKFRIFIDIVWPVILPAVITSTVVTFASGISAFSAPNLIGGGFKVLSTQIVKTKANNHMDIASLQVIILFLIGISFMILMNYYGKKYGVKTSLRAVSPKTVKGKNTIFTFICKILIGIQIILIMLPIVAIFYLSFVSTKSIMIDIFPNDFTLSNYITIFESNRVFKPMLNSINMSLITVIITQIITVPVAYLVVRKNSKYDRIAKFMIMLPWSMPASVIAVNLINSFNKPNIFAFNESLIGTYLILPIAYIIVSLPVLFSSNEVAMKGINVGLEEASRSLGADSKKTFWNIIIPNIMPGILAGGILAFIRTIGEYTMSALLYGVYNRPISISMVTNMQEFKIGISLAFGVLVIILCYISLALVFKLDRKRFM